MVPRPVVQYTVYERLHYIQTYTQVLLNKVYPMRKSYLASKVESARKRQKKLEKKREKQEQRHLQQQRRKEEEEEGHVSEEDTETVGGHSKSTRTGGNRFSLTCPPINFM